MKANRDICHFPSSLDISTKFLLPAAILGNPGFQKRHGVTIERELNFTEHVTMI